MGSACSRRCWTVVGLSLLGAALSLTASPYSTSVGDYWGKSGRTPGEPRSRAVRTTPGQYTLGLVQYGRPSPAPSTSARAHHGSRGLFGSGGPERPVQSFHGEQQVQVVSGRWKKVAVGEIEGACLLVSAVHDEGGGAYFSAEPVAPLDRILE